MGGFNFYRKDWNNHQFDIFCIIEIEVGSPKSVAHSQILFWVDRPDQKERFESDVKERSGECIYITYLHSPSRCKFDKYQSRLECTTLLSDPKLCHGVNPNTDQNWWIRTNWTSRPSPSSPLPPPRTRLGSFVVVLLKTYRDASAGQQAHHALCNLTSTELWRCWLLLPMQT